MLAVDEYIYTV